VAAAAEHQRALGPARRDRMRLLRLERGSHRLPECQQLLRHQRAQRRVVGRDVVLQSAMSARAMLAGTVVISASQ